MPESIGLVLAGGGRARGRYEIGAPRALLPRLERRHKQRPDLVGGSVGALNAACPRARRQDSRRTTDDA